jgi:hypothetical protein
MIVIYTPERTRGPEPLAFHPVNLGAHHGSTDAIRVLLGHGVHGRRAAPHT